MIDTLNTYTFELTKWSGEAVTITYSLPPLRGIPEYLDKLTDESALLEFICKQEQGFADEFTDDSIFALLDKVAEQMDPRQAAWISRQVAKIERVKSVRGSLGLQTNTGTASLPTSLSPPVGDSKK